MTVKGRRRILTTLSSSGHVAIHVSLLLLILLQNLPNTAAQAGDDGLAQPNPPVKSSLNVSNVALIVFLLFPFFLLVFFSFFFKSCCNDTLPTTAADAATRDARRTARGLEAAAIESFPTFLCSEVKHLKIGKCALECAVCLNEFEDNERLRMMPPCSHVFHSGCIDVWLFSHSTCPVCRTNLVPRPGESFSCATETEIADSAADPVPEQGRASSQRRGSEGPDTNLMDSMTWINKNRPSRSRSTNVSSWRIKRLFPRSHSTGHSLVQPDDDMERFTLRLPEEVRSWVMTKRTKSQTPFGQDRSSRKGYRSGSIGEERRVWSRSRSSSSNQENFGHRRAFSVAIPFPILIPFTRRAGGGGDSGSGSVTSTNGEMGTTTAQPNGVLGIIREPFDRLFLGKDDGGERSTDRLRCNPQV